jgi:pyrroline-5-carboxylate reductase
MQRIGFIGPGNMGSAMANPLFALKGKLLTKGDLAAAFPLKHMQKGLFFCVRPRPLKEPGDVLDLVL